jgi:hypothetical protein
MIIYAVLVVLALIVFMPHPAKAEQIIKIAILDTGYDSSYAKQVNAEPLKLCNTGHYDFGADIAKVGSLPESSLRGRGKHGTLVASIMADKLKDVSYCAVIYQVYPYGGVGSPIPNILAALKRALTEGFMAVNMSYSGMDTFEEEYQGMNKLSSRGVMLFSAAGNNGVNLDAYCIFYPACYVMSNKVTVGALAKQGIKCHYSNYGKNVEYYLGSLPTYIQSGGLDCATSYATPRALSDYVLSVSRLLHGDYQLKPLAKMQ